MSGNREATLENLEFLVKNGVAAPEAAQRTGFDKPATLERWLARHQRHDLWACLKQNGPEA